MMFTRDLIFGEMKYVQFGVSSISYNYLYDIPGNETHCRCCFTEVTLTEIKISFWVIKCYVKTSPKLNHTEGNICACEYKGNMLLELLLWHSDAIKSASHQKNRINFYQCFQMKLTTKRFINDISEKKIWLILWLKEISFKMK